MLFLELRLQLILGAMSIHLLLVLHIEREVALRVLAILTGLVLWRLTRTHVANFVIDSLLEAILVVLHLIEVSLSLWVRNIRKALYLVGQLVKS